jgi:hypothetical protein
VVASLLLSWGAGALTAQASPTPAPPNVTSISPDHGPLAGGTLVTVHGNNFTDPSTVLFSSTTPGTVTYIDSNTLTVVSPVDSGSVHVIVSGVNGSSTPTGADVFNYYATPVVDSISPSFGPAAGGTLVTINGEGFLNTTGVTFGATSATFALVNDGEIVATAPAGSGTGDVVVEGLGGDSATSAADQYTYTPGPPTVTSLSPTAGPLAGGVSVVLTGSGFTGATAVSFGANAALFAVNNSTQITATLPAGAAGTADVTVTTPNGTSSVGSAHFTYVAAPTVTGVSPNGGAQAGNNTITVTGTGFSGATAVTFGATAASGFTVVSSTSITATSPPGGGVVDVRVTTIGGTSAVTAPDQFVYWPPPVVSSVSPASGPAAGGNVITITGSNFIGVSAVTFGGVNATGISGSSSSLLVQVPAGTGTVDVRVVAFGVSSAINANDKYTYLPAPTVTFISPASGVSGVATTVTINGTGFTGATAVHFGTTSATLFTVNSDTQLVATSPASTAMTVDITVTTPNGTSPTSANDEYTWVAGTLGLSASTVTAGNTVTVSGTGFAPGATLDVVLHSSPVTLTTVTTDPTGAFSVAVTIPAGTAAGAHTIDVADSSIALTVLGAAALASTGSDPSAALGLAAALLALGLLLIGAQIRRQLPGREMGTSPLE